MISYTVKADYDPTISGNEMFNVGEFTFKGLSTDTKPVGEQDGLKILNGSMFVEMDTKKPLYYDEASSRWI